jgi:Tfp pilus assembly protein PilF
MAATAIAQNNLASLLYRKGEEAGAERLWQKALPVAEKMAPDSWDLVAILSSLAHIEAHKRDYDQAEELFRHALAIAENKPKQNHVAFVVLMNNYGLFLKDKGDSAKAETYLCRALSSAERVLGPNAPYTQTIRAELETVESNPSQLTH